jgi:exonuclease III
MAQLLKIAVWNVNGLYRNAQGIQIFIHTFNLDILLVSETHFTNRNYITTPNYNIYYTNHPEERVHGGIAVIIRQNIKHYVKSEYRHENIQATNIATEDKTGETTVSAIYCPRKHHNKYDDYDKFFKTLGNRFIAGGDCNAKNTLCESRLTTTKGRELQKVTKKNLKHLSTRQPTYWPSYPNKIPDLVYFCVTKGSGTKSFITELCLDLT